MSERVGRSVIQEKRVERVYPLSFFAKIIKAYYEFRIKMIEKRMKKYGRYSTGFRYELFCAALYDKQAYLHKGDALYMKSREKRVRNKDSR